MFSAARTSSMFLRCAQRATTTTTTTTTRSAQQPTIRRWLAEQAKTATETAASKEAAPKVAAAEASKTAAPKNKGWWHSAELWGALGAAAGWGMSGAAIYDASRQGPEVISLTMTPVLMVYSALFSRWAWVVKPQNLLLCGCHVTNVIAQTNQLRRALEHKMATGREAQVYQMGQNAAVGGAVIGASILAGPTLRSQITNMNLGVVSDIAAADAGPFTVHFWAPMSKWMISGASFFELDRPTENISLPQYTALTLTGFFFSRYALLVTPINYTLCSVNIALFASSAWHWGRKIKADYIDPPKEMVKKTE